MKRNITIITCIFALIPCICLSQWKITQNLNTPIRTIEFLDSQGLPSVGFCGEAKIFRTSDRGKSWKLVLDSLRGSFADVTFISKSEGWAICHDGFVYTTLDTGKTWMKLQNLPARRHTAIYHNPANSYIFISIWKDTAIYSSNKGRTWIKFAEKDLNGYAFCDYSHGLVTDLSSSHFTTADGGMNWEKKNFSLEIWQPLAIPGTSTIICASEALGKTIRSDDYGNSWDTIMQSPAWLPFSGIVLGGLNSLYAPTRQSGFYKSTDQGITWISICGPSMKSDMRFFVANDSIFAGDEYGNLWLNPTGTSGLTQSLVVQPISTNIVSNGCDTSYIKVAVSTIGCPRLMVDFRFTDIEGLGWLVIKEKYATPTPDTIIVPFIAKQSDTGCFVVKIRDYIGEFDTCVPIKIKVVPSIKEQLSFSSINTTREVCHDLDTILRIWSNCKRPRVTNIQVKNGNITVTPISVQLPSPISSYDTLRLSIKTLRSYGNIKDTIVLTIVEDSLLKKVVLPVSIVFSGKPRISFAYENIDVLECDSLNANITMSNPICEEIIFESISSQSADLSVESPVKAPYSIKDSGVIDFAVIGKVMGLGSHTRSIKIIYKFNGSTYDTTLILAISVKPNSSDRLSLSTSHVSFGRVSTCSTGVFQIIIANVLCKQLDIIKVKMGSSDNLYSLDTSGFVQKLYSGSSTGVSLRFTPEVVGVFRDSVMISYMLDGRIFDTSISVVGEGFNDEKIFVSKDKIDFGIISTCSALVDTIIITNISCDSTDILLGAQLSSNSVSLSSTPGGIKMGPFDSVVVALTLSSNDPATENGKLSVMQMLKSGLIDTFNVPISGTVVRGTLKYNIPDSISFGDIPMCTGKDTIIWLRNQSQCDTLFITSFDTSGVYYFRAAVNGMLIPPRDSVAIRVNASPSITGSSLANVLYTLTNGTYTEDDTLTMGMFGTSIKNIFDVGTDTINYGVRELCEPIDTTVSITNLTCGSILIDSIILNSSGFAINQISAPFSIGPNSTISLPITSVTDTNLGNITSLDSVVLKSGAYFKKIILLRGYQYPKQYTLSLAHKDTVFSGDVIDVGIQLFTDDVSQLRTVSFNLLASSEMLELVSQYSANQISLQGNRITISNGNGLYADTKSVIGWLRYRVYLTKDTIADYYISDQSINPIGGSISCPQSWLPQSSTYVYSFQCGERYIQKFLRGQLISILSVYPNPTKEVMNIQLSMAIEGDVTCEIIQVNGQELIALGKAEVKGSKITVPLNIIRSGRYQLILTTKYGQLSTPIVVSR